MFILCTVQHVSALSLSGPDKMRKERTHTHMVLLLLLLLLLLVVVVLNRLRFQPHNVYMCFLWTQSRNCVS